MHNREQLPSTISLIGMPGAGKSTVGVLLAKLMGLRFRDTDLDIQVFAGRTLQDILDREGHLKLRDIERKVLMEISLDQSVISTGGSVVYSDEAMQRLRNAGPVIYLEVDLVTLEQRISAAPLRGIASSTDQSFADVFLERTPLYRRYADVTVSSKDGPAEAVAEEILDRLQDTSA